MGAQREAIAMAAVRRPAGMARAESPTVAYPELVELALRLELLSDREGFARVRDRLKQ